MIRTKSADEADGYAGARMKVRRRELRMSQTELGEKVGISFQQVQKYENGVNRIALSRLDKIARALRVSPSYFFQSSPYDVQPGTLQSNR